MKTLKYDSREEWLGARLGKITGSRLGDVLEKKGGGKKIGYYELIAERLALPPDGENAMDRGTRLEEEGVAALKDELQVEIDTSLVIWQREDESGIAISPDGIIDRETAVEIKCLSSARHIEALLTKKIPNEYWAQALQYFIVNDDLQKLYFCFYEPRLSVKQFFHIEVLREDVQEEVEEILAYEHRLLAEVREIVTELSF